MKVKIKKAKPKKLNIIPATSSRVRLTVDNGQDYLDLYVSANGRIQYIPLERLHAGVATFLDCAVAWPDEETMVIDQLEGMMETFLPEEIEVLAVCNAELEQACLPLDGNVLIFPGAYLHSLESWKKREMKKDLMM